MSSSVFFIVTAALLLSSASESKKNSGQQQDCIGPVPTDVINYLQNDFFYDEPANYAVGSHPSGILVIIKIDLQWAMNVRITRAFVQGVMGYIHNMNGTFYYFPTFGCDIRPYALCDSPYVVPNLDPVSNRQLLMIATQLSKGCPYTTECSFFSFKTFSGASPNFVVDLPAGNMIWEMSRTIAGYVTTFNGTGNQLAKAAKDFASSHGYNIQVCSTGDDAILSEMITPIPRKCKSGASNLLHLSERDITKITSLQSGSACYWASVVAEFLSSYQDVSGQLKYMFFAVNRGRNHGAFFCEGYIPSFAFDFLYDPILYAYC